MAEASKTISATALPALCDTSATLCVNLKGSHTRLCDKRSNLFRLDIMSMTSEDKTEYLFWALAPGAAALIG